MTNAQIKSLAVGQTVTRTYNGRTSKPQSIDEIKMVGTCVNDRSGAFGHYFAQVYTRTATGNGGCTWAMESDEYIQGAGYPTHDADGKRICGEELVQICAECDEVRDPGDMLEGSTLCIDCAQDINDRCNASMPVDSFC